MIRRILPILLVAVVLLGGCRSRKEAAQTTPQPDSTASQTATSPTHTSSSRQDGRSPSTPVYTPHFYTSTFTCNAQGVSASGQMRLQQDSVIWLCATKVIELGRAMFTPDSVIVYAKVMNRCFRGNYDDMAQRFHYRTTFKQLYKRVSAPDAEQQLTDLFARFGIEATIKMGPLKEVDKLNFPFVIPKNASKL